MSELQHRFSEHELRELRVTEWFWPTGQAADNKRAILIGLIIAQRIAFDKETEKDIERIRTMLDGSFHPQKDMPQGIPSPEQMKDLW